MLSQKVNLKSYNNFSSKNALKFSPNTIEELADCVNAMENSQRSFSISGGRNSFGDVFLPTDLCVIDITKLNRILFFDEENKIVQVECGCKTASLMLFLLVKGFYLNSISGSPWNTVSGDVSSNVNGKDSFRNGNFYYNVLKLEVLLPGGKTVLASKTENEEIFNSVISGLGGIGIITILWLKVEKLKSYVLDQEVLSTLDIKETLSVFEKLDEGGGCDFVYSWTDSLNKNSLGRSLIYKARFSETIVSEKEIAYDLPAVSSFTNNLFWFLYRNSWCFFQNVKLDLILYKFFNYFYYNFSTNLSKQKNVSYLRFQYPMVSVLPNWNKRFVRRGMQEIHCVFNKENLEIASLEIWRLMDKYDVYSELTSIRKAKADYTYLSFSLNGYMITFNYDRNLNSDKNLYSMEREICSVVIKYGGRIYLSKFPYLTPDEVKAMYPRYFDYVNLKMSLDPNFTLKSCALDRIIKY